eukprot:1905293-Alexandrium_andersonii.AAC.1
MPSLVVQSSPRLQPQMAPSTNICSECKLRPAANWLIMVFWGCALVPYSVGACPLGECSSYSWLLQLARGAVPHDARAIAMLGRMHAGLQMEQMQCNNMHAGATDAM